MFQYLGLVTLAVLTMGQDPNRARISSSQSSLQPIRTGKASYVLQHYSCSQDAQGKNIYTFNGIACSGSVSVPVYEDDGTAAIPFSNFICTVPWRDTDKYDRVDVSYMVSTTMEIIDPANATTAKRKNFWVSSFVDFPGKPWYANSSADMDDLKASNVYIYANIDSNEVRGVSNCANGGDRLSLTMKFQDPDAN